MKLSICIPAFNAEGAIRRCLESTLAQELTDTEIVVIDNCSDDGTVAIASAVLAGVANSRVLKNESNVGRVGNWNRCITEARGQFLKFVFTNDQLLPGSVALLLKAMTQRDGIVMVGSKPLCSREMPQALPSVVKDASTTYRSSEETLEFFAGNGFLTGSLNGMLFDLNVIRSRGVKFREDIPYFADFAFSIELARYGDSAIIDAESYWFNAGADGRYHYVGLKRPRDFFLEHRVCTDLMAELLAESSRNPEIAFNYLRERYYWYVGQGAGMRPRDAWAIFRGRIYDQISVAARTFWFQLRQGPALQSVGGDGIPAKECPQL